MIFLYFYAIFFKKIIGFLRNIGRNVKMIWKKCNCFYLFFSNCF